MQYIWQRYIALSRFDLETVVLVSVQEKIKRAARARTSVQGPVTVEDRVQLQMAGQRTEGAATVSRQAGCQKGLGHNGRAGANDLDPLKRERKAFRKAARLAFQTIAMLLQ